MDATVPTIVQQLAEAARVFQLQQTGRAPSDVTVVMDQHTVVFTLHEALSPAEQALANSPEGSANLHQFYQHLFRNSEGALRNEIERITGRKVLEAAAEIDPGTGGIVHIFSTGTTVHVFLLDARPAPALERNDTGALA